METIERAAELLKGLVTPGAAAGLRVMGRWRGRPVTFEEGRPSPVTVTVPTRGGDLRLEVRRQHGWADREIARGELIDVTIGDAAFDAAMLIDAAPEDVVRMVFASPSLRTHLQKLDELLSLRLLDKDLVLEVFRCEASEVRALLDVAVDTAIAVEEAHDLADTEAARTGSALALYRGGSDHTEVEAGREADIQRRDDLKRKVALREVAYMSGILFFVLGLIATVLWLGQ